LPEKEALAAQVRSWSRFGVYAVTANELRACGIGLVENGPRLEQFAHVLELKTVAAFGSVIPAWQEVFDEVERSLPAPGRLPALRERHVFYGQVAPQAIQQTRCELADGTILITLFVDASKVAVDRPRYQTEVKAALQEGLLALYGNYRQNGDLLQLRTLDANLRALGCDSPDGVLLDYLQALQGQDDTIASTLLEELAPLFPELPLPLQTAVLENISRSPRKTDCQFLIPASPNTKEK